MRYRPAAITLALACSGLVAGAASAQQVYRHVGPDGRVTYSDAPAASGPVLGGTPAPGPASANAALPYELRQVASRYPVTLYSGTNCAPCESARALLASRGIPYQERSVTTTDDGDALQRLAGERSVPVLTVGAQLLRGFSNSEWNQYLDAAGYPRTSRLPAGWHPAPASPLAARSTAPSPTPASAAPVQRDESPPPAPSRPARSANNPAGIQF